MEARQTDSNLKAKQKLNILSDGLAIIRETKLTYDPGDKINGSLYLCDPANGSKSEFIDYAVKKLGQAGLWSNETAKTVRDDQKDLYAVQLNFIEAFEFELQGVRLFAARFDHPKFPSNSERFLEWKKVLGVDEEN